MPAQRIRTESLGKRYRLGEGGDPYDTLRDALTRAVRRAPAARDHELWALRDVDLEVHEGEALGVVGRNGAGKSTLLKVLARITHPSVGTARTRGRVGVLLEVGTGFHPELTGRENVFLNGVVLGMSRRDVRARFDEIVDFAGVERFLDTPLKRYSTGMHLRLAFAVAAHLEPDVMIVDEVLAVGDFEFQRKCLGRVSELQREGRTALFVSHDLSAVSEICTRAIWLDGGRVIRDGDVDDVVDAYLKAASEATVAATFAAEGEERAELLSAALVDDDGRPLSSPRRDQPFALEITFVAHERIVGLNCEVWLHNRRGVSVLDESWEDDRDQVGHPTEPGTYRTVVRIPPVLVADDYTAYVWIGSEYEEIVRRELFHFALRPVPSDVTVWDALRPGRVVQPGVTWTVESTRA